MNGWVKRGCSSYSKKRMYGYYIFNDMNMKKRPILEIAQKIASSLQVISPAPRTAILLAIGTGEACVCHLEALLGWRQAYISQHLMALRRAGILNDRREGRYIFYRVVDPGYLGLLQAAAALNGIEPKAISHMIQTAPVPSCLCPHCSPVLIPLESVQAR